MMASQIHVLLGEYYLHAQQPLKDPLAIRLQDAIWRTLAGRADIT